MLFVGIGLVYLTFLVSSTESFLANKVNSINKPSLRLSDSYFNQDLNFNIRVCTCLWVRL